MKLYVIYKRGHKIIPTQVYAHSLQKDLVDKFMQQRDSKKFAVRSYKDVDYGGSKGLHKIMDGYPGKTLVPTTLQTKNEFGLPCGVKMVLTFDEEAKIIGADDKLFTELLPKHTTYDVEALNSTYLKALDELLYFDILAFNDLRPREFVPDFFSNIGTDYTDRINVNVDQLAVFLSYFGDTM